jgi:hypothetical protein
VLASTTKTQRPSGTNVHQVPDLVTQPALRAEKLRKSMRMTSPSPDEPREDRPCQVSARQKKLLTRYQPSRSGARSRCAIRASSVRRVGDEVASQVRP